MQVAVIAMPTIINGARQPWAALIGNFVFLQADRSETCHEFLTCKTKTYPGSAQPVWAKVHRALKVLSRRGQSDRVGQTMGGRIPNQLSMLLDLSL